MTVSILKPKGFDQWQGMPLWARWTAIDSDGTVGAYEDKPYVASRQWVSHKGRFAVIGTNPPMRAHWEQSLCAVHAPPPVPTSRDWHSDRARQSLRRVLVIGCALFAALAWFVVRG